MVNELKEYIYLNNKIEYILEQIGCTKITYHSNNDYYSSCQADGDNEQGVNIKNCKYLNYRSYTRGVDYSDGKDLINLVQDTLKYTFAKALKYCDNPKLKELGYKRMHFLNHKYFMMLHIEDDKVIIDNIFHELQDYENYLI